MYKKLFFFEIREEIHQLGKSGDYTIDIVYKKTEE